MNHKEFVDTVRESTRQVILDGSGIITQSDLEARLSSRFSDIDILEISLNGTVYIAGIVDSKYLEPFIVTRPGGGILEADLRLIEDSVVIDNETAERITFSQYFNKFKNVTNLTYPYYVYEDARFISSGAITELKVVNAPERNIHKVPDGGYTYDSGSGLITLPAYLAGETPVIVSPVTTHTYLAGDHYVYDTIASITGELTLYIYPVTKLTPPIAEAVVQYTVANILIDLGFTEEAKNTLKGLSNYIRKYTIPRIDHGN